MVRVIPGSGKRVHVLFQRRPKDEPLVLFVYTDRAHAERAMQRMASTPIDAAYWIEEHHLDPFEITSTFEV